MKPSRHLGSGETLRQEMASPAAPAAQYTVISSHTDYFPLGHPHEAQMYISCTIYE